jgi:hypothetical protein
METEPVLTIDEPAILIRISRSYRASMSPRELYEATRGVWRVGARAHRAVLGMAVYRGVVVEVYEIAGWAPAGSAHYESRPRSEVMLPGRSEFTGKPAQQSIREKYIGKSVQDFFPRGASNPIRYVKC